MTTNALHDLSGLSYRNVLVVDDEPAIHQMFSACLQPDQGEATLTSDRDGDILVDAPKHIYDFHVHAALSGEEALSLCKRRAALKSPIQLAFVDMRMRGWDGIDTILNLREFDPRLNFVLVTGFPEPTRQQAEERLGAAPLQIFPKPVKLEEIYNTAFALVKRWNRLHGDD